MPSACAPDRFAGCLPNLLFASLILLAAIFPVKAAWALAPRSPEPGATIVIRNDRGGSVRQRYNEIQRINRLGQSVEIRGSICMSSCTMFLGADNVCVSPETTFGFHGPFRFGARLSAAEFDEWSNLIASHYPASVKTWYIHKARHQSFGVSRLKGRELIRLGVARCR